MHQTAVLGQKSNAKVLKPLEQALKDLGILRFTEQSVEAHKMKVKNAARILLEVKIQKEEDLLERRMARVDILKFFLSRFAFSVGVIAMLYAAFRWAAAVVLIYLSSGTTVNPVYNTLLFGVVMFGLPITLFVFRKGAYALLDDFFEKALIPPDQISHLKSRLYYLDWREYDYGFPGPFLRGAPQPPSEIKKKMESQVSRMKKYMPDARPFISSLDSEPFFGFERFKEKYHTLNWGEPEYFPEYVE